MSLTGRNGRKTDGPLEQHGGISRIIPCAVLLLLAVPVMAWAPQADGADIPLSISLSTASKAIDISESFNCVVTLTNHGMNSIPIGDGDTLAKELPANLDLRDREGVVYQLFRFTKEGMPYPNNSLPLVLQPNESREFSLGFPLTHDEHSDYRFVREGHPGDTDPDRGFRTLPPGNYQIRAHYRYTPLEDEAESAVDLVSAPVSIQFR